VEPIIEVDAELHVENAGPIITPTPTTEPTITPTPTNTIEPTPTNTPEPGVTPSPTPTGVPPTPVSEIVGVIIELEDGTTIDLTECFENMLFLPVVMNGGE
jgi:hypothetical protein